MRLRERMGGSGEKRDLLEGPSERRTLEPATNSPAEVAPKYSDFAPPYYVTSACRADEAKGHGLRTHTSEMDPHRP
jgi:hypothetical protein